MHIKYSKITRKDHLGINEGLNIMCVKSNIELEIYNKKCEINNGGM